jgi:membrane dipeptidase
VPDSTGLNFSFRQDELNDNPPGDYDPTYWWPKAAGYDRSIERMTYTPIETWQPLSLALQGVGMSGVEAGAVMGENMLRVANQVWHRPHPLFPYLYPVPPCPPSPCVFWLKPPLSI